MATLTKPVYKLDTTKKDQFVGILLLNYLINEKGTLPLLMQDDFKVLDKLVTAMVAKGYLQVSGSQFVPTTTGKQVLGLFMNRYLEYLKVYDIFCSVDTEKGEFAYDKYYDFDTDEEWKEYVNEARFNDVRIAVAEFKKLDAMEIVFMSFINEERFDTQVKGWQFDVYTGLAWGEIEHICNTAISMNELNGDFPEVTENIVKAGAEVAIKLLKIEDERKIADEKEAARVAALSHGEGQEEYTEEVVEEVVVNEYTPDYYYQPYGYYETYYDPLYISPVWLLPLLVL